MQCSEAALLSYKWVIHHFLDMYFFIMVVTPRALLIIFSMLALEEKLLQEDAVYHNVYCNTTGLFCFTGFKGMHLYLRNYFIKCNVPFYL